MALKGSRNQEINGNLKLKLNGGREGSEMLSANLISVKVSSSEKISEGRAFPILMLDAAFQ